jgi:hypothetical protein
MIIAAAVNAGLPPLARRATCMVVIGGKLLSPLA